MMIDEAINAMTPVQRRRFALLGNGFSLDTALSFPMLGLVERCPKWPQTWRLSALGRQVQVKLKMTPALT